MQRWWNLKHISLAHTHNDVNGWKAQRSHSFTRSSSWDLWAATCSSVSDESLMWVSVCSPDVTVSTPAAVPWEVKGHLTSLPPTPDLVSSVCLQQHSLLKNTSGFYTQVCSNEFLEGFLYIFHYCNSAELNGSQWGRFSKHEVCVFVKALILIIRL